jgi:AbiJ N-terminal domain 4
MSVKPPFSRRVVSSSQSWIQDDFPESARTALLHLLHDLIDRNYVGDWIDINKEARRIAREVPGVYDRKKSAASEDARISSENLLYALPWPKMFDFCERLQSHLAAPVRQWDGYNNEWEVLTPREEVQRYIAEELQRIFIEEHLGYSFVEDEVRRRGRYHTNQQIARAEPTLGDPRLNEARTHFAKARQYFDHPSKPDYENSIKEAVCAVEAAARRLFPQTKAKTLGEVVNQIRGSRAGQLPKPIADTLTGLYAFRNSGEGVGHGGSTGGKATQALAEYALAVAASQIILLHTVASEGKDNAPF